MLSDDLRRRLEALNRDRLTTDVPTQTAPPRLPERPRLALEKLGPSVLYPTPAGDCYVIIRRLSEFWPDAPHVAKEYNDALRAAAAAAEADTPHASSPLRDLLANPIDSALYVDIETCGFAGTPLFLIGTMRVGTDDLHFELLLARNYAEESAILHRFAHSLAAAKTLVTFNGKSFDLPFLRDRAAVHRIDFPAEPPHLDLLHEARRTWKDVFPDCKLQTLETYVLSRTRRGDIPGAEIPAAYHDFVATGDARQLAAIGHHNLLDLTTMAQLIGKLRPFESTNVP